MSETVMYSVKEISMRKTIDRAAFLRRLKVFCVDLEETQRYRASRFPDSAAYTMRSGPPHTHVMRSGLP